MYAQQTWVTSGREYIREYDPTLEDYDEVQYLSLDPPTKMTWVTLDRYGDFHPGKCIEESAVRAAQWVLPDSDAYILVYSSHERLDSNVEAIYQDQLKNITDGVFDKPIWVVHNKIDLSEADREVTVSQGEYYTSGIGATFRQMSTKTGEGTEGLGLEVATRVLDLRKSQTEQDRLWEPVALRQ
jgi:GTPase Era involved in 16S rRNA processing